MTAFAADRMTPEMAYEYLCGRSDMLEVQYQAMLQKRAGELVGRIMNSSVVWSMEEFYAWQERTAA